MAITLGLAFAFTDLAFSRSGFVKVIVFLLSAMAFWHERGRGMGFRWISERVNAHTIWTFALASQGTNFLDFSLKRRGVFWYDIREMKTREKRIRGTSRKKEGA